MDDDGRCMDGGGEGRKREFRCHSVVKYSRELGREQAVDRVREEEEAGGRREEEDRRKVTLLLLKNVP